jgi:hypothetical protein
MITEKDCDLDTLNYIKQRFDIFSDLSTTCQGYKSLCRLIKQLENNPRPKRTPLVMEENFGINTWEEMEDLHKRFKE